MDKIKQKVNGIYSKSNKVTDVKGDKLEEYGLKNITLRSYQLHGVNWLIERYHRQHGCILGDEMGLGKTCQTIGFLVFLHGHGESKGPHLILSPLSVLSNWKTELQKFAPELKCLNYFGSKDERPKLQRKMKEEDFNVVITTYEMCIKDESFLKKINWHTLVVDEAHRLKNVKSLLHQILLQLSASHRILLTGTPVQNNMTELYSLLSFVAPTIFRDKYEDDFVSTYSEADAANGFSSSADVSELHDLLKPFLLRRIKSEVVKDLPKKSEVLLYHGLSALQKKYYKAILTKDIEAFENPLGTSKTRLMNILMQLRKCVNHPYLFDGVEPEPFALGEHLVEASGKLVIIDQLLHHLKVKGHKVLLFSQMTRMLDIIQDYLGYRGYSYERLDGSVRGEERFLAIQNFNEDEGTFIFLLSTKAGGQGLNLVAADTVIFVDSDFNPQNDLQAAARAHRIGQTRAVKIVRLVGRSTVEEIVLKRAEAKLKLTNTVIEGGHLSTEAKASIITDRDVELQDILKFGVDKLFETDESSIEDLNMETILGPTEDGVWQEIETAKVSESMETEDGAAGEGVTNMYTFEGMDYSTEPSAQAKKTFADLLAVERAVLEQTTTEGRSLRKHKSLVLTAAFPEVGRKPRKVLTEEELEARKQKRAETAARRAKEAEEAEVKKAQAQKKKREQMWVANGYTSHNIDLDSEGEESEEESVGFDQSEDEGDAGLDQSEAGPSRKGRRRRRDIEYLVGDVTHPQHVDGHNAILVHCVDDSGRWGNGGLFSALDARSINPDDVYTKAGAMQDLALGDAHLIPLDEPPSRDQGTDQCALIVAQHRDKRNNLSGIKLSALSTGLKKVYRTARDLNASVHLPRIGHNTPGFNWYGTERLIRKLLASKGIPTYIYYYPRRAALKRKAMSHAKKTPSPDVSSESDDNEPSTSGGRVPLRRSSTELLLPPTAATSLSPSLESWPSLSRQSSTPLPSFMQGVTAAFYKVDADHAGKLRRHLVAYDGDSQTAVDASTTHIVVDTTFPTTDDDVEELSDLRAVTMDAVVVTTAWLRQCFKLKSKMDTTGYAVLLKQ